MKFKILALAVILTAAGIFMLMSASKAKQKSQDPQKIKVRQIEELEAQDKKHGLTLRERVKLAKLRNEQKITVRSSHNATFYLGFADMDTAAAVYTIVIAKPVAAASLLSEEELIVTLYRFKTIEVLSEPDPSKHPYTFSGNFHHELGTFESGDFLVSTRGGTANIDGVEVTTKYDDFDIFSLDKEYLLFLDFDTTKTVGGMDMGPLGALEINGDGTLDTLDKQQSHDIKQVIDSRFGNSVETLKAHLKSRSKRTGDASARPLP